MKSNKLILIYTVLVLAGCQGNHSHDEAAGSAEEVENEVSFSKIQAQNAGIKYGKLERRNINSTVKLIGRIELPPTGRTIVSSKIDGEVISIHIIEGQRIKKGQKIFSIQNLDLIDWNEEWLSLNTKLEFLNNEIERQKKLTDEAIAPLKNYESMIVERNQALYKMKSIESKFNALGKSITKDGEFSPILSLRSQSGGILQKLIASRGAYIQKGQELAEIIDNHHLHIHLSVYSEDVGKIKVGQEILFNVQSEPEKMLSAHVKWIDAFVNRENNSYQIHAEIEGEDNELAVGEFVEARVINHQKEVMTLPESAISYDKGLTYIFAKEEEHEEEIHFQKLQVRIGESDMGYVEILPIDSISDGQDIVVEGAFYLMAQSKKGSEPSGHSH